jgi:carboxy-terminal domain RNA polymerase II polypeptide A small phosphatase
LDETLVHSTFNAINNADFVANISDEHGQCSIYVKFRPGAKLFLKEMTKYFEVVIFTASMSSYASQVVDELDSSNYEFYKLYREHCRYLKDSNLYVKDLSRLGRDLGNMIIIDNIPQSYCLQPTNGIPILSWIDDPKDRELLKMIPLLERLS